MAVKGFGRGKVVALMGTGQGAVPPQFAQLEAYWQALRPADGSLPRRSDFDPRGIADLLDSTLLLERVAPGQLRIRLAGMALCDLLGMELRGMPLSALLVPAARDAFAAALAPVFDRPCIAEFRLEGETGILRPALSARLLVLPMAERSGTAALALACLVTEGRSGRPPRRLTLLGSSTRVIDGLTAPILAAPAPGLAESPSPFTPAPPKGKPRLRLVKG